MVKRTGKHASARNTGNRRKFLQVSGAATAGLATVGTSAAGAGPRPDAFDVIIIGGGLAGLTAAREARHAGLRAVVLEARNRLGGRTFYGSYGKKSYDLGGAWVHWLQPHMWAEINRYGLEIVEMAGANPAAVTVLSEGSPTHLDPYDSYTRATKLYETFHAEAAAMFPQPYDPYFVTDWKNVDGLSVAERIAAMKLAPLQRDLLAGILTTSVHGLISEGAYSEMLRWYALSAHSFGGVLDATARYKFVHGTPSLISSIAADADAEIVLGAPVEKAVQRDGRVFATTEDGETFAARRMIVTVPLNVLGDVEFSPPLSDPKRTAASEGHAGQGIKGYFRVAGSAPNLLGIAAAEEPISMLWADTITDDESVFVMFGPEASRIDLNSTSAVQAFVDRLEADIEVVDTLSYDWNLDPFSAGTWCTLKPNQASRYLAALNEPEGLIHFASADSAFGWRGFMDGAIEAGIAAGRTVGALLNG